MNASTKQELAALVSLDFVGAGVSASDDGFGNVTVTIAGGGGYNSENARDDIGAALVAGTGITITPDDGADTITITAKAAYQAGPPTAPTTAGWRIGQSGPAPRRAP